MPPLPFQGKIRDRVGFFPANFVQRVEQHEKIYRCVRTFIGCKDQGQITLKENQVSKADTSWNKPGTSVLCHLRKDEIVPMVWGSENPAYKTLD